MASTILWSLCYVFAEIERTVRGGICTLPKAMPCALSPGAQAIVIRTNKGKIRRPTALKDLTLFSPVSMRSRFFFALLTLELNENHMQRLIANVLRGVRQRLAKHN